MKIPKLKKCPFCGGEARMEGDDYASWVVCMRCNVTGERAGTGLGIVYGGATCQVVNPENITQSDFKNQYLQSQIKAAKFWNKRAK